MRWWTPAPGEPELMAWWRPLLKAARTARENEVPWPIHIDEFAFCERVKRDRHPDVWVYRHNGSGGILFADDDGRTYKFIEYLSGPSRGRFAEIDVRQAIWRAGLPNVVKPVWYERPPRPYADDVDLYDDRPPPAAGDRRLRLVSQNGERL
jgi:hypothetical protein